MGAETDEMGQKGVKLLHLRHHSQKIRNPKPKNFFSLQTQRLAESFNGLNSFLALCCQRYAHAKTRAKCCFLGLTITSFKGAKTGTALLTYIYLTIYLKMQYHVCINGLDFKKNISNEVQFKEDITCKSLSIRLIFVWF